MALLARCAGNLWLRRGGFASGFHYWLGPAPVLRFLLDCTAGFLARNYDSALLSSARWTQSQTHNVWTAVGARHHGNIYYTPVLDIRHGPCFILLVFRAGRQTTGSNLGRLSLWLRTPINYVLTTNAMAWAGTLRLTVIPV
ncbi:hypothetical protein K438DRAFT_1760505 [Mycena galopus ATCC 62051]|nr:hypothetical protein K438DRAFT_1760505 [Mycena galopus ATCC 62051]